MVSQLYSDTVRKIEIKYFLTITGVGIRVGGNTGLNYLVLQIHYNDKVPIGFVDNKSAYIVTFTTQP